RAELVVHVEHEATHVLLLLEIHAGHRLVEQQELGLGGERAAELDALLQAVGQLADRDLADVLDLEEIDDALDHLAVLELLALGRAEPQRLRSEEHTSELQSPYDLVCRLLLEKKNSCIRPTSRLLTR